jgi:MATE family multidrug resistance protein
VRNRIFGPRNQQILRIALPSIVSNITVPLLGLVDVAIVGHMGSAVYIGAIAVGAMIFNLIYWLFGFLRMGTSGMTSQALGRRDLAEVMRLFLTSLAVGVGIALCFIILQWPLRELALLLMHPTADVLPLAVIYFNICIWGAPAMMGISSLNGWFIGMQNTRIPMLVSIVQNVVNILVSLVLVLGLEMKIEGVAWGTVIAQWTGFVLAIALWYGYYGRLRRHVEGSGGWLVGRSSLKSFFVVNRDIFLRTLFLVAVNLFFTAAGARQGAVILSVNTLLMQLYLLFSYVMDGFAYAGEALGGRYYGAHNAQAFRDVVHRVFVWGTVMVVFFTFLYGIGGTSFLQLLTDEPSVVAASRQYFFWALFIPVSGMVAFVWDGIFIGITATRGMLLSSLLATVVFFIFYFLMQAPLGNHALWLSFVAFLLVRGLVSSWLYKDFSL